MRRAARLLPLLLPLLLLPLPAPATGSEDPPEAPASFPASWEGTWRGPCRYGPPGGGSRPVTMELVVAPIEGRDAWTWTVVYEGPDGSRQVRPYELVPVDRAKGHWRIDEKNGIVLDAYLVDDTLHGRFAVQGNVIESRDRRREGGIDVEIATYGEEPVATTGGEGRIPAVRSFGLRSVQRGRLVRVE